VRTIPSVLARARREIDTREDVRAEHWRVAPSPERRAKQRLSTVGDVRDVLARSERSAGDGSDR
jgi:hypothetical protein